MNTTDNNFADLLKQLRDDSATLVKAEVALVKTELSEKAAKISAHAVMVIIGGLLAHAALIILLGGLGLFAAELIVDSGLSRGTAALAGFGLVALTAGIIGASVVVSALEALKKQQLIPRKSLESLKADKQLIQNKLP